MGRPAESPHALRTLPLLSAPYEKVHGLHRAVHDLLEPGLARRQALSPSLLAMLGFGPAPPAEPEHSGDTTVPLIEPPGRAAAARPGPQGPALLAAPASDLFAQIIEYHLRHGEGEVVRACDAEEAAQALHQRGARLAILDLALPHAQGLLDHIKLSPDTNAVPTVALLPGGMDPARPDSLRVQADVELGEPVDVAQLLAVAERLVARSRQREPGLRMHVRFILPSTRGELEGASDLAAVLFRHSGLAANNQTRLLNAFREALANAIQHGNGNDPHKAVRGHFRLDDSRITVGVRDDGPGFDYEPYLRQARETDAVEAARRRHQEGGQGGLGIFMILRCADHVEYNDAGNALTFVKLLGPSAGAGLGGEEDPAAAGVEADVAPEVAARGGRPDSSQDSQETPPP